MTDQIVAAKVRTLEEITRDLDAKLAVASGNLDKNAHALEAIATQLADIASRLLVMEMHMITTDTVSAEVSVVLNRHAGKVVLAVVTVLFGAVVAGIGSYFGGK